MNRMTSPATRLDALKLAITEVFFPPQCLACARVLETAQPFCGACSEGVTRISGALCQTCGEPGDEACARCASHPPPMHRSFAPFLHDGAVARAIHRWKYEDHAELTPVLGAALVHEAEELLEHAPKLVTSVPLHERRYRERRYDQAQLLASEVAKRTGRTLHRGLLRRVRFTERQVGLSEHQRDENVRDAFEATEDCQSLRILLIDDVLTTGATARAATQALLERGAEEVWVLTLARAFTAA